MKMSLLADAPNSLKWAMGFIERIGFPIAVSIYMGYLLLKTIPQNTQALRDVQLAIVNLNKELVEKSQADQQDHQRIMRRLRIENGQKEE